MKTKLRSPKYQQYGAWRETVETVPFSAVGEHTSLKRGVNERRAGARSAFTMIEIAISLAVIGFALVAIIGILPQGLNVQRDNREQTIINQDLTVFMDA